MKPLMLTDREITRMSNTLDPYEDDLRAAFALGRKRQRARDAEIARAWKSTMINPNGVTDYEATHMCNYVAQKIAAAIEREGSDEPPRTHGPV